MFVSYLSTDVLGRSLFLKAAAYQPGACPGYRSIHHLTAASTALYCTALYCTTLYCTSLKCNYFSAFDCSAVFIELSVHGIAIPVGRPCLVPSTVLHQN